MRILLTGASGQLGQQFLELATDHDVVPCLSPGAPDPTGGRGVRADLAEAGSLARAVRRARPDWVVHAAAMTNVDACERDPALADLVNGHATGVLATAAREEGARFLYVSTDYVFDGASGPYREEDAPNPLQAYGRSKLRGEREALAADGSAIVARTAVVYGPHRANFVKWLLGELAAGRPVRLVKDQAVSPTLTEDLAGQILALLDGGSEGIFHTAGATGCSRIDLARAVCAAFVLPDDLLVPVEASEVPWIAQRPRDTRLRVEKVSSLKDPFPLPHALARLKSTLAATPHRSALSPAPP